MLDIRDYKNVVITDQRPHFAQKTVVTDEHELIGVEAFEEGYCAWVWGIPKKYDYIEVLPDYPGKPTLIERIDDGWRVVAYADDPDYGAMRYTMRRERQEESEKE